MAAVVVAEVVEVLEAIVLVVAVPNLNKPLLTAAAGVARLPNPGSLSVGRAAALVGVGVALTAGDIPRPIVEGAALGVGAVSTTAGFETDSTVVVVVATAGFTDAA